MYRGRKGICFRFEGGGGYKPQIPGKGRESLPDPDFQLNRPQIRGRGRIQALDSREREGKKPPIPRLKA